MCKICSEWQKGKLTSKEALGAVGEVLMGEIDQKELGRMNDIIDKVLEKELINENS